MVEAFPVAEPRWAAQAHACCDPPGRPLGSAGGAVHALVSAWRAETAGAQSLEAWLTEGPLRQVIHAGGESRRLPSYATSGKAFIPVPVLRWSWGGRLDQCLLDLQAPLLDIISAQAPASAKLLIASGDVAVLSPPPEKVPEADMIITGLWTTPEAARNFGVLFCDRADPSRLITFLQKPTAQRISELAERHLFLVDAGIWLFSARAVERLMKCAGWNSRKQSFGSGGPERHDLYHEWALGLGEEPEKRDPALAGLTVAILPLPRGEFHHFGSSRDIIQSVHRLQNRVLDQTRMHQGAARPHPSQFIQNSVLDHPLAPSDAETLWIENSHIPASWQLTREHVLTGIPRNSWTMALEPGVCLDWQPVKTRSAKTKTAMGALRFYGFHDPFRGALDHSHTHFLGRPAREWFIRRGLDMQDAGGADCDLQQARIFPVQPFGKLNPAFVTWLFSDGPAEAPEWAALWKRSERVSAADLLCRADPAAVVSARAGLRRKILPVLAANGRRSIFYRTDLNAAADELLSAGIKLPPPPKPQPGDPPLIAAHDAMLRSVLARRQHKAREAGRFERDAFALLRREIVGAVRARPVSPACTLLEDQILWARSPVRLDLAGGWTDTPPYCIEHGGSVLNVAVELNGQPPIQIFIRRTAAPEVGVRSIDLGLSETLRSYDDIAAYAQLGSGFAIARAALALAGFHPDFLARPSKTLKSQLSALGGGLEISLLCAVPKGSGLGTSSILAAALLGALSEYGGLGWDHAEIMDRTLALEQMLGSGGGWQDQAGGIHPGIKLVETDPGFDQRPRVRWLPASFLERPENAGRMMLYYTGLTRVAHGILGEIVRGLFLNRAETLQIVGHIGRNAQTGYDAFQRQDMEGVVHTVRRSWELNQQLDRGTNTPEVQKILDLCGEDLAAAKLLGAGGGGYFFMIARDLESAARLRARLTVTPPNPRARFVAATFSNTGLQITRS